MSLRSGAMDCFQDYQPYSVRLGHLRQVLYYSIIISFATGAIRSHVFRLLRCFLSLFLVPYARCLSLSSKHHTPLEALNSHFPLSFLHYIYVAYAHFWDLIFHCFTHALYEERKQ